MVRVYIDLETYRPRKEDAFINERIILGGLLIDETPYSEDSLNAIIKPIQLKEWGELNEQEIVTKSQSYVKEALSSHRFTVICGFNILRFDIPLLLCKSTKYSLGRLEALSKMWNDCFSIDYFQQLLTANGNLFKGLKLENVVRVADSFNLKPPPCDVRGRAVKDLYDQRKWKEIEKHNEQDLNVIRWLDLYGAKRLIKMSVEREQPLFYE